MMMKRLSIAVVLAALVHSVAGWAQVAHWQGAGSDSWFAPSNWSPAGVPAAGTNVIIDTWSPNNTVVTTLGTAALGAIQIGETSNGELVIENGGVVTNNSIGMLGTVAGSTGFVIVQDSGSQWNINHNLVIGQQGFAHLQVSGGGEVRNNHGRIGNENTGSGGVTVNNGSWVNQGNLFVAHTGSANLDIRNGGSAFNGAQAFVGYAPGSEGSVRVRGGGNWGSLAPIWIGREGEGTLSIESGGSVVSTQGYIGAFASGVGDATVTGAGSNWTVDGDSLTTGVAGRGRLVIENGGSVWSSLGVIGDLPGSTGSVAVVGFGSQWTINSNLFVGKQGLGNLTITVPASVECNGAVFVGFEPGAEGVLHAFGSLTSGGGVFVQYGGLYGLGIIDGAVQILAGGEMSAGHKYRPPHITAPLIIGTIEVGELAIASGGTALFDLGAPGTVGGGVNDLIVVQGDLALGGILELNPLSGFAAGTYTLFTYSGSLTGGGMTIVGVPAGLSASLDTATPGEVRLVVGPASDDIFSDRFED